MASERVQKILAQAGIASRRKAEELITEGLVTINGKPAKLGDKADFETDSIKVRGKLLQTKEEPVYLAFYKPRGVISTLSDPDNRPTISDFLKKVKARVFPIGRLDFSSEGLLLLTNDGKIAAKLQKLEGIPRVYHVKVRGKPDPEMVKRIEAGARLGNRLVRPHSVRMAQELQNKIKMEVVFTESGAIDIKALFELKGFLVESIRRTALGHITLRGLAPGEFRTLKASQVEALFGQPELGFRQLEKERADEKFRYKVPSKRRDEEELPPGVEKPKRFGDHFRYEKEPRSGEKPGVVKRVGAPSSKRPSAGKSRFGSRDRDERRDERPARRDDRGSDRPWGKGRDFGRDEGKTESQRPERPWNKRTPESRDAEKTSRPSWGKSNNRNDRAGSKPSFGGKRRDENRAPSRGGAKPSFGIRVRRKNERED
jgi:23S rRNA pseudouridine2605 synthase